MVDKTKINPFPVANKDGRFLGWKWRDANGVESDKSYPSEGAALHALLKHMQLPWWQRLKLNIERRWKRHGHS